MQYLRYFIGDHFRHPSIRGILIRQPWIHQRNLIDYLCSMRVD